MKRSACLPLLLTAVLLCSCGSNAKKAPTRPDQFISEERQFAAPSDGDTIAIFSTSLGEVRAVLYPDAAPMAVYNFVGLARSGYYDGTIIWRSQYSFAVQGGDATGTGTGGSTIWSNNPYPLEADASLKHYAGALCMGVDASGECASVFYVVQTLPGEQSVTQELVDQMNSAGYRAEVVSAYQTAGGAPYLDYTDTVLGQVYEGMDVVDAIGQTAVDENQKPREDITINSVSIETYQ